MGNICKMNSIDGVVSVSCGDFEDKFTLSVNVEGADGTISGTRSRFSASSGQTRTSDVIGFYDKDCEFELVDTEAAGTYNGKLIGNKMNVKVLRSGPERALAWTGEFMKEEGDEAIE
ncbi:hypothetical protein ACHAWF_017416 [Thalassiosira exigua]